MIGSRGVSLVVGMGLMALLVAACGDDDASGANPERFCEIDHELEQLEDPLELPPDEARELAGEYQSLFDESVKVAPDEIRASVKSLSDSFTPLFDFLEAANFDAAQVDEVEMETLLDAVFSGESEDAGEAMDDWVAANCS